jgi:hypothetical protein
MQKSLRAAGHIDQRWLAELSLRKPYHVRRGESAGTGTEVRKRTCRELDDSQKKTAAPHRCPGGQLQIYLQVGHLQLLAVLLVLSRRKFGTAAACDKIGEFKQGQGAEILKKQRYTVPFVRFETSAAVRLGNRRLRVRGARRNNSCACWSSRRHRPRDPERGGPR